MSYQVVRRLPNSTISDILKAKEPQTKHVYNNMSILFKDSVIYLNDSAEAITLNNACNKFQN